MNLIYFIRLLIKNALPIVGAGLAMSVLVYMTTRNKPVSYTASTTVYAGIATGYDIEPGVNSRFDMFSHNARFDNLVNIIKSRETLEETAIRLMARHLILAKPDPAYCLPETWRLLMADIPAEIKRMADNSCFAFPDHLIRKPTSEKVKSDSALPRMDTMAFNANDTLMNFKTVTERVQRFRIKPKYYMIRAGDSPNGIAQRFGLTLGELERMNTPMPQIQGGRLLIVGTVSESFWVDTLITKMVPADVESKMSDTPGPGGKHSRADPVSEENPDRYERLVRRMMAYKDADQENYLFRTLQSANPFYSVRKISEVKVSRIQSSDLLKLTFDSNDPAVCMQTLKILTGVFSQQYQSITTIQKGMISGYFRERVNSAKKQLDSLERNLLDYRRENRIINYDEQTKSISEQKEILDRDWYGEAGKISAAKTALALIEDNIGEKGKSLLLDSTVLEKRQQMHDLAGKISMAEIQEDSQAGKEINIEYLARMKGELELLKLELNTELMKSFELAGTVKDLNIQNLLQKWFEKTIEAEESQARFNTLTYSKKAFMAKYDEFAPLGSQLKKIDREIDLAQQAYMNHLNNLNQSILRQKNLEQPEIQVIDNPVYPIKPNASGRMVTVIAAFLAGLILTAVFIILLELLDNSIKFPMRFAELSGLKLMGAYPRIPLAPDNRINYPLISSRATDQIAQRIRLEDLRLKDRGDQPFMLFFISTREREGKTYLATRAVEKLRASGSKVLYVKHQDKNSSEEIKRKFTQFDEHQEAWDYEYTLPDNFIRVRNINELLRNYTFFTSGYQYLVIELPALLVQEYPATLTESGHLSVLVGLATRAWNQADKECIRLYQSSINHPVLALLNGCQADQLEPILGEIPKRRSYIRKLVKRIINLDFKTKEIL